ncbi:AraC family transcriptional regulator [Bordetella sp. FB-8]|uniref:helix-turn-helix transcriptional regulator n=1 Tax=Bordetella sp. FB-8 TaxID=1159870 RepID=UPI0003774577|nr:AraC family transcriptional regulator [Bordetella sp. FB-8]
MNDARIDIRRYRGEIERHRHAYHQVVISCEGTIEIEVGRETGRVAGSLGAFIPAGCQHAFLARQPNAFVVLDVQTGGCAHALDNGQVPPFFAIDRRGHGLLEYMRALDWRARLTPACQQAWSTLLLDSPAVNGRRSDRAELVVQRATSFMLHRLADPICIADLAQAAGVSPRRLHEAFRARRETTPHTRLTVLRLDAAERLLADPALSIAEIALRSGHADQSALTRAMRRERDATPAEVRCRLTDKEEKWPAMERAGRRPSGWSQSDSGPRLRF